MTSIADYQFVSQLGDANHGTFHLARTPQRLAHDAEFVMVKVLDRRCTEADFKRFAHEMRVIASVGSPYLTPLLDAGQSKGRLYYAVPHYSDGPLTSAVAGDTAVAIVRDAALGAHDLHEVGVVHRDIKPANVFVEGEHGHLGDLGLASMGTFATATVGVGPVGSIEYMEPDVVYGEPAGRTSDVWSLAVTLHAALTGSTCHPDVPTNSVIGAFRHVLQTPPSIAPSVDDDIADVLSVALAPDRSGRFRSALEFADALSAARGRP